MESQRRHIEQLDGKFSALLNAKKTALTDPKKTALTDHKRTALTDPKKTTLTDPKKTAQTDHKKTAQTDHKKTALTGPKKTAQTDPKKTALTDLMKTALTDPKKTALTDPKDSALKEVKTSALNDTTQNQQIQTKKKKRKKKSNIKKKQALQLNTSEYQKKNVRESQSLLGNFSWLLFYQLHNYYYWFHQVIFRHPVNEPPFNPRLVSFVDMICIPFQGVNPLRAAVETRFGRHNEKLWFHGTPLFQSAESILNGGLNVGVGRRRNDFSVGEGFYVSDDFDTARCRAKRNKNGGYAVLVFRLQEQRFSNCFLDLNRNITLWRKVVRFNRSGYEKEADLKAGISQCYMGRKNSAALKKLHFNEIDFIKGPMCSDVPKILDDNCTETPILMTNSSGRVIQQLCIRNHSYAQVFGSLANICAVFWFLPGP